MSLPYYLRIRINVSGEQKEIAYTCTSSSIKGYKEKNI